MSLGSFIYYSLAEVPRTSELIPNPRFLTFQASWLFSFFISPPLGLQTLQHNPYTEPLWKAAVAQYERGVAPAEVRIAGKLRLKFQQLQAQPHLLLREFQRYQELIKRPNISKELTTERYSHAGADLETRGGGVTELGKLHIIISL